ncbi:MAG: nucleotidyltransferase family protein [Candidatus Eremiobacteraeota bacterium]|nr:nucleotidyltransferase family protein [Candidatus Eremiobacteraeota bacterium]
MTLEDIKARREEILKIGQKNGVCNIAVFGSVVRGQAGGKSDVDFLIDMEPGRSLFDLSGFMIDLEDLLGYKVDVAMRDGLRESIREQVLKEAVRL